MGIAVPRPMIPGMFGFPLAQQEGGGAGRRGAPPARSNRTPLPLGINLFPIAPVKKDSEPENGSS